MALKTAADYDALFAAHIPTATAIGQLMWASMYAARDPANVNMPEHIPDELARRLLGQPLRDVLVAVLATCSPGACILAALADAEVLPDGTPAMAAGSTAVTGKGKIA